MMLEQSLCPSSHEYLVAELSHSRQRFLQLNGRVVDQPLSSQDHVIGQLKEHIANQAMCLLSLFFCCAMCCSSITRTRVGHSQVGQAL